MVNNNNKQSVTITFVSASVSDVSDMEISVEMDDEVNQLNLGKTSGFIFGESVAFRIYVKPFNTPLNLFTSAGTVAAAAVKTEEVKSEIISFAEPEAVYGGKIENIKSGLEKPCLNGFSSILIGGAGVGILLIDPADCGQVLGTAFGIGIYQAKYNTQYVPCVLSGVYMPPIWPLPDMAVDEPYPVTIMVIGE